MYWIPNTHCKGIFFSGSCWILSLFPFPSNNNYVKQLYSLMLNHSSCAANISLMSTTAIKLPYFTFHLLYKSRYECVSNGTHHEAVVRDVSVGEDKGQCSIGLVRTWCWPTPAYHKEVVSWHKRFHCVSVKRRDQKWLQTLTQSLEKTKKIYGFLLCMYS